MLRTVITVPQINKRSRRESIRRRASPKMSSSQPAGRRRKLRGALDALARHDAMVGANRRHASSTCADMKIRERPECFTAPLNDFHDESCSPPSSPETSPIARRRPHRDSLVSTAHSMASADSVRAELERIQNLEKGVASVSSLSSRCAEKPNYPDVMFRGYSNRRQSSSSAGALSAGLGGGGSVSSLSHLTASGWISRGSFSSIPRVILNDDNDDNDSNDPLSYNFWDSDSDVEVDELEDALCNTRIEKLTDIPKRKKSAKPLLNDSPPAAHLDVAPQYHHKKQIPAVLSPQPEPQPPAASFLSPGVDRPKRVAEADEGVGGMSTLPVRKEGSWRTALGA